MITINFDLLSSLGLNELSEFDKKLLCTQIYETLEMRVGERLAGLMSNQQIDEFEVFFEQRDDKGASAWLEANFPNYKEIVQAEFEAVKREVRDERTLILAAATEFANRSESGETEHAV